MIPYAHRGAGILILILAVSLVIIVGGLFFFDGRSADRAAVEGDAVCPADVKVCTDGSIVVRAGAGCAFALCPDEQDGSASVDATTMTPAIAHDGCVITGCSSHLCAEEEIITTCDYRPDYACYAGAICERQENESCGWTMTDSLTACLATPPTLNVEAEVQ